MKYEPVRRFSGSSALIRSQLIVFCLTGCVAVAQTTPGGTGAINGYVYCADTNTPARMATVRVQSVTSLGLDSGRPGEGSLDGAVTLTGMDGSFRFDRLTPGDYVVLVTLRGYLFPLAELTLGDLAVTRKSAADAARKRVENVLPRVSLGAGQTAWVTIRLERGAEISGAVSFDDGAPVIGAQIQVYRQSYTTHQWDTVELPLGVFWNEMSTDGQGQYRVTGIPAGKYLVSMRFPSGGISGGSIFGGALRLDLEGFIGQLQEYFGDTPRQKLATVVDLASGEHRSGVDIQIPLSELRTVSGTVTAESDGHPLKNTILIIKYADDGSFLLRARGADDGTFKIPFVPRGEYVLTISAAPELSHQGTRSYNTATLPLTVDENISGIQVELPDASTSK